VRGGGFAVARVDLRGTGASDGIATDEFRSKSRLISRTRAGADRRHRVEHEHSGARRSCRRQCRREPGEQPGVREDVRDDSILAGIVWVTGSLPSVPRVAEKRDQRLVVNAPQRLVGMLVGLDEARTCTASASRIASARWGTSSPGKRMPIQTSPPG
jgi:hypothetical protein